MEQLVEGALLVSHGCEWPLLLVPVSLGVHPVVRGLHLRPCPDTEPLNAVEVKLRTFPAAAGQ